jgi:hypothetical protein
MFNPNQAFLLVQKLKSAKGFTVGDKAEIKNIFSICPTLLINVELYGLHIGPEAENRISSNLGSQFATLGANVPTFINILTFMFYHLLVIWGQTTTLHFLSF